MGRRRKESGLGNLIVAAIIFLLLSLFLYPEKTISALQLIFGIVLVCCVLVFIFKYRSNHAQQPTLQDFSPVQRNAVIWSVTLIKELDWKVFEQLCADYLSAQGYQAIVTNTGADGGIDIKIYGRDAPDEVIGIAQCKAWKKQVGIKEVRELLGIMADASYKFGIYFATSTYTQEAIIFAKNNNIQLMDAVQLLHDIEQFPIKIQEKILIRATAGDYTTPSCPNCDSKLVIKTSQKGRTAGEQFWACPQFPRCRYTMRIRKPS
ncbi:MAG: restriction endonuclease [Proteobacteria bacterium]|nr:restriction endonuclease [Pseudomonadota bacterium]